MKKTLKEQLDRSQELIQFDNSGAEERTSSPTTSAPQMMSSAPPPGPCMEISAKVCYQGSLSQPPGTVVQFPCSLLDTNYADNGDVGSKVQDMGAGYGQGTYEITSVSANPNFTGPTPSNPHLSIHGAWKYPCGVATTGAGWFCLPPGGGGQGSCQYSPSMTIGTNGPFPTEQDCETAAYCAGSTVVDCTLHGVDYDPVTLDNTAGGFFHPQGLNLATNGNCQGILNKIQQVNNITNQDKKDCRLDYLNLLLSLCQGNSGLPTLSPNWIALMTNRYNGTGAASGCNGLSGNNTNSVCGRKAHFCPGSTPMKQAKCQWLTNFTSTNNCNC